jgi:hypothetical protein
MVSEVIPINQQQTKDESIQIEQFLREKALESLSAKKKIFE